MTHAYDGCTCVCHTSPPHSVMHCVPCCGPGAPLPIPETPESLERQAQLEDWVAKGLLPGTKSGRVSSTEEQTFNIPKSDSKTEREKALETALRDMLSMGVELCNLKSGTVGYSDLCARVNQARAVLNNRENYEA